MDRRKRKSRKAIIDACIALTKEKEFQQITIHEIVERADLNRGTFYLHFVDKVDMLKSFEQEMLDKIEDVFVSNIPAEMDLEKLIQSRYETLIQIFHCYEENKDLLQFLIISGNSMSFQTQLQEKLKGLLIQILNQKVDVDLNTIPIDLLSMIFTSVSLNLAQYTYKAESPVNIETHAQFLINIMLNGPLKAFGLIPNDISISFNEMQIEKSIHPIASENM